MAILLLEEVDLKKIKQRFKEVGGSYHEVDLGYPNIGDKWTFDNVRKIHFQDWKNISEKIKEDYKNREIDYNLILASANLADRSDRIARCFTRHYKLKK